MKTFANEKHQPSRSNTINSNNGGITMPSVPVQKKGSEEELPVQGKFVAQLKGGGEEEEPLQMKPFQLAAAEEELPVQKKKNNTGLPDNLKSGIENLSGACDG
jgi:hypothetical protein